MNTANPTRIALMDLAEEILQTKSYASVSFQTLAEGVGIKKGSVYYHFETKAELGEAIIDRAIEKLKAGLEGIQLESAAQQLVTYSSWFENNIAIAEKLCPVASFAASWNCAPESIQMKVEQLYRLHKSALKNMIQRGQDLGELLITNKTADELATTFFALLQGGLLASRVTQDKQEFAMCKALALENVLGHCT